MDVQAEPNSQAARHTAPPRSANGIATAMSSTASMKLVLTGAACASPAHAGRHLRGDRGDPRPSLLPGLPVPPGIQVEAAGAASAVQRFVKASYENGRKRREARIEDVEMFLRPERIRAAIAESYFSLPRPMIRVMSSCCSRALNLRTSATIESSAA